MTRTVWLASYPKSGNTWLRMLIANLSAEETPMDINDLPQRSGIASARAPFDYLTLIDSGLLTHDEVDLLRPRVYEELARGAQDDEYDDRANALPVRFVKVHDAYTLTPAGEPLLAGRRGADAAIVIVRDPRDIVPSLANHRGIGIDEAIDFLSDSQAAFSMRTDRQPSQLRQKLPGWSGHVASWLDQTDVPVHVVRYEDLQADALCTLRGALAFAGLAASEPAMQRAVAFSDFAQLRRQEQDKGFREAPPRTAGSGFFRRGESGAWRQELDAKQAARIEAAHAAMMRRLGYQLTPAPALAMTG